MSTSEMLLSVIIPTYNYATAISRAICSVTSQLNEHSELIVIDDGSTDQTSSIVEALLAQESLAFRYAVQENAGPAAARNHGFRLSKGRFLLFLDADDELLPGALEEILHAIDRHSSVTLIVGAHLDHFPDGVEKTIPPTPISGSPYTRLDNYLLRKRISISHGASVFHRSLIAQRSYPEQLRQSEDIPVFAYAVATSTPLFLQYPLARIHKHPDSLRHDARLARSNATEVVNAVFAHLPTECEPLRERYRAKRALSVFRNCYLAGDVHSAREYYALALRTDFRQALRWAYLSKYLRMRLGIKRHI